MSFSKLVPGLRSVGNLTKLPLVEKLTQSGSKAALAGGPTVAQAQASKTNKVKNTLAKFGIDSSSAARLALAGLGVTALSRIVGGGADNGNVYPAEPPTADATFEKDDWRIKLSLPAGSKILYADTSNTILAPIRKTEGIIFPILPQIQVTHDAKYSTADPTHSNHQQLFYKNSTVSQIVITCDFPVQTNEDGLYLLAVVTMLRSATKMFFGKGEPSGNPPPVLRLNGYGSYYFPDVPVVVTNFTHTMPPESDYLKVSDPANGILPVRMPTLSQVIVSVTPVYSRAAMRQFDYNEFAKGNSLGKGFI